MIVDWFIEFNSNYKLSYFEDRPKLELSVVSSFPGLDFGRVFGSKGARKTINWRLETNIRIVGKTNILNTKSNSKTLIFGHVFLDLLV